MEQLSLRTHDNENLSVRVYEADSCKAVIQLVHGMEEHQERYAAFASVLNQNGYTVVSSDLRGHGRTAQKLGHFKDKKGYEALIQDQILIREFIGERYPDTPVYLFAHSMGTIISRVLLQTESGSYKKTILSGAPNYQALSYFGLVLTSVIRLFRGAEYKSALLEYISIGVFNKAISDPKTDFDWLSSNEEAVKGYVDDPYCGKGFTCTAFNDLYKLMTIMHKHKAYKALNADMPILMLSGKEDPCTGGEKGVSDSFNTLIKAGFRNVKRIDYPGMRHEILNEKNNDEVYRDIVDFYDN